MRLSTHGISRRNGKFALSVAQKVSESSDDPIPEVKKPFAARASELPDRKHVDDIENKLQVTCFPDGRCRGPSNRRLRIFNQLP